MYLKIQPMKFDDGVPLPDDDTVWLEAALVRAVFHYQTGFCKAILSPSDPPYDVHTKPAYLVEMIASDFVAAVTKARTTGACVDCCPAPPAEQETAPAKEPPAPAATAPAA